MFERRNDSGLKYLITFAVLFKLMPERKIKRNKVSREKKVLLETIINAIKEKKGNDIVSIDLQKISNRVTDYFVVCHAETGVHLHAIMQGVDENVKKLLSEKPYSVEGASNAKWILLDYVTVVVHIMLKDVRKYYNLEDLWADAGITNYSLVEAV